MADALNTALEAIRSQLEVALPGRLVTRQFLRLGMRSQAELQAGVVCVVCLGEQGFANYRGREADLGTLKVVLVGHLEVPDGPDAPGRVELAELALAGEIKAWLAGPPAAPLRQVLASGWRQSGQLEAPSGWVVFELEVMT